MALEKCIWLKLWKITPEPWNLPFQVRALCSPRLRRHQAHSINQSPTLWFSHLIWWALMNIDMADDFHTWKLQDKFSSPSKLRGGREILLFKNGESPIGNCHLKPVRPGWGAQIHCYQWRTRILFSSLKGRSMCVLPDTLFEMFEIDYICLFSRTIDFLNQQNNITSIRYKQGIKDKWNSIK